MATAISIACIVAMVASFGATLFNTWFYHRLMDQQEDRFSRNHNDALTEIRKKDERIGELDRDYKALAESYIRDTGKVFIRPVPQTPQSLPPAQPNPWRNKPPPRWVPTEEQSRERGKQ